ncbi:glutamate ABC transporter substrate-binding protein [Streptomyces sp. NPDC001744]|uniref:glutamate ABC transporter substrate-binding protein n=1 Tax=Streptomyces sp. NPDC001744 TaxID=3364606 RepID=UPI00369B7823
MPEETEPPARRTERRPRGWGGVAAMALACALSAGSLALLPAAHDGNGAAAPPGTDGPGTVAGAGVRVRADTCRDPEKSLAPSTEAGPAVRAIKDRGKLVVGVDQSSYRWGYRNPETGALEGFDIALAEAIAQDIFGEKGHLVLRAVPTNQRTAALKSTAVDLVVRTMTITCERLGEVAFSTPYFRVKQQVLAPRSDRSITGYDSSLRGRRVCTAEESIAHETLEKESYGALYKDKGDGTKDDEDLLTVPNQLDCLVRLQMGEVDAIVTDDALAAGLVAQDPTLAFKGGPFPEDQEGYYGVAVKLGNDDLVRRVNHVLEGYRRGPWQQAYEKWLKEDLPGITGPPEIPYK